jgi:hypothetical protein
MAFLCAAPYWYTGLPLQSIMVVWHGMVPAATTKLQVVSVLMIFHHREWYRQFYREWCRYMQNQQKQKKTSDFFTNEKMYWRIFLYRQKMQGTYCKHTEYD